MPRSRARLRPLRDGAWCDYVTKIERYDGDLTVRPIQQSQAPVYFMSELGVERLRRLIYHSNEALEFESAATASATIMRSSRSDQICCDDWADDQ